MSFLHHWILREDFWLPKNFEWSDLEARAVPTAKELSIDLINSAFFGILLYAISYAARRYMLAPIAFYIRPARSWRSKTLARFTECSWTLIFKSIAWTFGLVAMINQFWFMDRESLYKGFPYHELETRIRYYYIAMLSFYWSRLFGVCHWTRRKDFWLMLIHDIVTLVLLTLSFLGGFTRGGMQTFMLHEVTDFPLLLGKILIYLLKRESADIAGIIFVITWCIARLGIYPFGILRYTLVESWGDDESEQPVVFSVIKFLACLIMAMNIVWTYFIFTSSLLRFRNKEWGDSRSSCEEGEDSEDQIKNE